MDGSNDTFSSQKKVFKLSLRGSGAKAQFKRSYSSPEGDFSKSITSQSVFASGNENRRNAFEQIYKEFASLRNNSPSPTIWEEFQKWCIRDDQPDGDSSLDERDKSFSEDVFGKCRMTLVDIYGGLPSEKDWKNGKEWFDFICCEKQGHQGYLTGAIGGINRNTVTQGYQTQYGPETETRREMEEIRNDLAHTDDNVEKLKRDMESLQQQLRKHVGERHSLSESIRESKTASSTVNNSQIEELEDELCQKDSTIETLERQCKNLEETIEMGERRDTWERTCAVTKRSRLHDTRGEKLERMEQELAQRAQEAEVLTMQKEQLSSRNREQSQYMEEAERRVNELERECGQLQMEKQRQDNLLEKFKRENEILHHNIRKGREEASEKNKTTFSELRREIQRLETEKAEALCSIRKEREESKEKYQAKFSELLTEIHRLETEKADALSRLSTLASAKLTDNNPEITDLSDVNRPQKLAEKYSELYDNEWTDAYEFYTNTKKFEHERTVAMLLNTFEDCFHFCRSIGGRQNQHILAFACFPFNAESQLGSHGDDGKMQGVGSATETVKQKVVELRKVSLQESIIDIKRAYKRKDSGKSAAVVHSDNEEVKSYIDKCLEISWLACIQDPPLEIRSDFPPYSKFDSNIVRKYTKSGEFVDYVIWPALLLSADGALLSKGVVQCTSTPKGDQGHAHYQHKRMRQPNRTPSQDELDENEKMV